MAGQDGMRAIGAEVAALAEVSVHVGSHLVDGYGFAHQVERQFVRSSRVRWHQADVAQGALADCLSRAPKPESYEQPISIAWASLHCHADERTVTGESQGLRSLPSVSEVGNE
jgi:hypothetical protein